MFFCLLDTLVVGFSSWVFVVREAPFTTEISPQVKIQSIREIKQIIKEGEMLDITRQIEANINVA